jgi:biofilm protein TabA
MIIAQLSSAPIYASLGPRFAAGLDWLADFSPTQPDGRIDIDGDNVFALIQSYETHPAAEKKYESHHAYADIQYLAAGTEVIHYAPVTALQSVTPYDAERDCMLYADSTASTPLLLTPGTFAVFLPADGHKPGCDHDNRRQIKKVVIKVRL